MISCLFDGLIFIIGSFMIVLNHVAFGHPSFFTDPRYFFVRYFVGALLSDSLIKYRNYFNLYNRFYNF